MRTIPNTADYRDLFTAHDMNGYYREVACRIYSAARVLHNVRHYVLYIHVRGRRIDLPLLL